MVDLFITWDVSPVICKLGSIEVRWYGILFAGAFIISYLLLKKLFAEDKVSVSYLDKLTLYVFIAVLVGARLGHCLFYDFSYYSHHITEMFLPIKQTADGWKFIGYQGLASHGGAIGILIAVWLYQKRTHLPYMWILDRLVIAVCFAGLAIRTGNLFNSEIYGIPTRMPWGFVFVRDYNTVPCHPTQLYEGLSYLVIGLFLYFLLKKKEEKRIHQGVIFSLFLILVFSMRFLIEFIKNDQEAWEENMVLDMGQILSLPFIIAGCVLLYFAIKKDIGRELDLKLLENNK
ncbi:MAG: prolipoprotein diacylglyceryl transferase [Bacteroidales bacterium]|nr:prolipoprotein diacylglyceryl transferase [Bacteroidales bacterium]